MAQDRSDTPDSDDTGGSTDAAAAPEVRSFDFRRPTRLGRERVRSLELVHDDVAAQLAAVLSSSLRVVAATPLTGITESTYGEFVGGLPNPTHLNLLSLAPLPGTALLHVPLATALTVVDMLLGGRGRPVPERPLTELEVGLVQQVIARGVEQLRPAYAPLAAARPEIIGLESSTEFVKVAAPTDTVVIASFELTLVSDHPVEPATISICYPYSMLQPVLEDAAPAPGRAPGTSTSTAAVRAQVAQRLSLSPIELAVRFAPRQLSGLDILGLRPGDVVTLPHSQGEPLTVFAGDVPVLEVQPTRNGNRVAARVTRTLAGAHHAIRSEVGR